MAEAAARYAGPDARVAEGWSLGRLTPPSRLFGANGIRTAPDGRIYVAQVSGSQISAVDVETGLVEAVSPKGGDIVAPDDLVFDDEGNFYATEITEGRVSMTTPAGETRTIHGDLPCANPIEFHDGRLFAGECRPGGRILELDRNGGEPHVLADGLMMPNAMQVGPDGRLYFPLMGTNEIWRMNLDGSGRERVMGELGVPDAVKFDRDGFIVSTQVASGQVLRINPQTGEKTMLAQLAPGLDNVTFVGERIFVSNIAGHIDEILPDGNVRPVIEGGFNWPLGLAVQGDGTLFVGDGPFSYTMKAGGAREVAGLLFTPGSPGYVRGVASVSSGEIAVTTSVGTIALWDYTAQRHEVIASGLDQLYGIVALPDGSIVAAETGAGRVLRVHGGETETLASGLDRPIGVAADADGRIFVSEAGAGRVLRIASAAAETVLDGLGEPQGVAVAGGDLYAVDTARKEIVRVGLDGSGRRCLASGLPVGAPPGVTPKPLGPIGDMSGPMGPFAGIAIAADGTVYVSADAEGSVMALRPLR